MFSCPVVETWSSGANTYCPHWPELGHSLGRGTWVPQRSALANPAGGGRRVWDERDPVSGSSTIASCINFILGGSHPFSFSSACRSSVSALLCCFAQFFHCVELLCFCALLCFVPCSVLCFALFCSSLSSSVLLCSVGLFCFAAKPCFALLPNTVFCPALLTSSVGYALLMSILGPGCSATLASPLC